MKKTRTSGGRAWSAWTNLYLEISCPEVLLPCGLMAVVVREPSHSMNRSDYCKLHLFSDLSASINRDNWEARSTKADENYSYTLGLEILKTSQ